MPRHRRLLFAAVALAAAAVLAACQPVAVPNPGATVPLKWGNPQPTWTDVAYGSHPDQRADIYLPTKGGNRGVIILVHGGGFHSNPEARQQMVDSTGLIMRQTHRGFAVFSISYRGIQNGHVFPAAVRDADQAVNWVRAWGRGRNMNPSTIIVAGGSAGGTISALVGTGWNSNPNGALGRTAKVDGWVSLAGILDARDGEQHVRTWLGGNARHSAWFGAASPITHLDVNDPPGYVVHGDHDNVVSMSNLDRFVQHAKNLGISDRLHYDRVDTGPGSCRWHLPQCGANRDELDRWLDKVVARQIP